MPTARALRLHAVGAAAVTMLTMLTACEPSGPIVRADTFPMGQAGRFDQPVPDKPLFGSNDYMRSKDVLPVALVEPAQKLPPAVPLPVAVANIDVMAPTEGGGEAGSEQGGAHPASGMAQGITNAQGDGETNKLDTGSR